MKIRIGGRKGEGVSSSQAETWRQSWSGIHVEATGVDTSLVSRKAERGQGVGISRCVEYLVAKNNIGLAPRGPIRGCSCKQEMGGRDYANPITESPEIFLQPWILEGKGGEEGVFSSF